MRQHHTFKISLQVRLGQQSRIKPSPDQRLGPAVVFKQLVIKRQAKLLQGGHGRRTQQGGEPAVKGPDLHRTSVGKYLGV